MGGGRWQLEVSLRRDQIPNGLVLEVEVDGRAHRPVGQDRQRRAWYFDLPPGQRARLIFDADGCQREERRLEPGRERRVHSIFPVEDGQAYILRGRTRVPVEPLGQPGDPASTFGVLIHPRKVDELQGILVQAVPGSAPLHVGPFTRVRVPPPVRSDAFRALRRHRDIIAAGPIVTAGVVLTHELLVRFRNGTSRREAEAAIHREVFQVPVPPRVSWVEPVPQLYRVVVEPGVDEAIVGIAERLASHAEVLYAEPVLASLPKQHAVPPPLHEVLWDRRRVGVEGAWTALKSGGRTDLVLTVVDSAFPEATVRHPEFRGRYLGAWNFNGQLVEDFEDNEHSVRCMGVAAAAAGETPVTGAAPGVKVAGQLKGADDGETIEALRTAAGLRGEPGPPGADVILASCALGPLVPVASDSLLAMLEQVALRGRGGRGTPIFISAGNDKGHVALKQPISASEFAWICGAVWVNWANVELHASYSNHGDGISWCTPSDGGLTGKKTWTSSLTLGDWPVLDLREYPIVGVNGDRIRVEVPPGVQRISLVYDAVAFVHPDLVSAYRAAAAHSLTALQTFFLDHLGSLGIRRQVSHGDEGIQVSFDTSGYEGGLVVAGPAQLDRRFGGTSSANALAAGIGALVLSANPDLTWTEVHAVLRDTARTDTIGGYQFKLHGHGRLDAQAAVEYALTLGTRYRLALGEVWLTSGGHTVQRIAADDSTIQLHARVRSVGAGGSLRCWVRFYVAAYKAEDAFPFPERWPFEPRPVTWGDQTTVYVDDHHIDEGAIEPHGWTVAHVDLPLSAIPPAGARYAVLVELAPYHHQPRDIRSPGLALAPFEVVAQ